MKTILAVIALFATVFSQEASDYYGRPVQEIQEKIWVIDTILTHTGGFNQSYYESQNWAFKNKDSHFKSIVPSDSLGIVLITLHSDCRTLRTAGPVLDYYMAITSHSTSLKIEFWNIEPKSKDCDKIFRQSLIKGVIDLLAGFSDSMQYIHVPCKGFVQAQQSKVLSFNSSQSSDSLDKLFAQIAIDSVRVVDSITRKANAIASEKLAARQIEVIIIDTITAQRDVDSISRLVDADSILIRHKDIVMFKGQPTVSSHGKIDVDTRIQCLGFLLQNKLRPISDVQNYLILLQKYCNDKADMIRAMIPLVPDSLKYKCAAVYHHVQTISTKVQEFASKIVLSKESLIIQKL